MVVIATASSTMMPSVNTSTLENILPARLFTLKCVGLMAASSDRSANAVRRLLSSALSCWLLHAITHAAHGANARIGAFACIRKLLAQRLDVDIHRARLAHIGHAPYLFK